LDLATGLGFLVLRQDLLRPLQQRTQPLGLGHDGGGIVCQILLPAGDGLGHGCQRGGITYVAITI
jgi:hypothetical protein